MFPHFAGKIMFESVYPGGKIAAIARPEWPVGNYSPKNEVAYLVLVVVYTPLGRLRCSSEPMVML